MKYNSRSYARVWAKSECIVEHKGNRENIVSKPNVEAGDLYEAFKRIIFVRRKRKKKM
jgi:hypothetical protein